MGERVYGHWDAMSERAVKELADSIEAVPIRTLKYSKNKGNVYLVKFHETVNDSFISRLPTNLLRILISYNTVVELLSLTMTCKRFSKFLFDRYISFNGDTVASGLYLSPYYSFQDHYDLVRIAEIRSLGKRAKVYTSIRPEFTNVLSVNAIKDTFLAYFNSEIIEGGFVRYSDSLEIRSKRPCIANSLVFDVFSETILCASAVELAISLPTNELRIQRFATEEKPVSVRFLSEKRLILVQKAVVFEVYFSETVSLVHSLRHEGYLTCPVRVPDISKPIFVCMSHSFVSIYGVATISGEIQRKFQWKSDVCVSFPTDFAIYRAKTETGYCDFLFILLKNGYLLSNGQRISKGNVVWRHLAMVDGRLIAGSDVCVFVFAFDAESKEYRSAAKIWAPFDHDFVHVSYSRMKAMGVYKAENGYKLTFFYPNNNRLFDFFTLSLPEMDNLTVTTLKEVTVIKGNLMVTYKDELWPVPCVYIVNFNLNSLIEGEIDVIRAAQGLVELKCIEKDMIRMRKAELKRREKEEKQRKSEEREKKHKPKH